MLRQVCFGERDQALAGIEHLYAESILVQKPACDGISFPGNHPVETILGKDFGIRFQKGLLQLDRAADLANVRQFRAEA